MEPDGLDDDQRRAAGNLAEDFHSTLLRINKTASDFFAKSVCTLDGRAF
jgi:hypothetical protein